MRLRYQLIGMTVLPLLIGIGLTVMTMMRHHTEWKDSLKTGEVVAASRALSALIHEVQKERGYSAGFIASKGKLFGGPVRK